MGTPIYTSDGQVQTRALVEVLLPGAPIVGEGKPENQNHAMVCVHQEFLQTLDMNQVSTAMATATTTIRTAAATTATAVVRAGPSAGHASNEM